MRLTDWTKRRIFRTPRRSALAFEIADLPATAYRAWRKLFVSFALMPGPEGKTIVRLVAIASHLQRQGHRRVLMNLVEELAKRSGSKSFWSTLLPMLSVFISNSAIRILTLRRVILEACRFTN
jgi:GNAT superfamily N-acetyltransferase